MTIPQPDAFRDALVAAIPHLRAFALCLCRNSPLADDLVQETLLKGWQKRALFAAGTNLKAWLFTILRNNYISELRKPKHLLVEANGDFIERLSEHPTQPGHLDLLDLAAALGRLESAQREALILVGAEGFSYEEAADICGCAVGTIKSRVHRARHRLSQLLHVSEADVARGRPPSDPTPSPQLMLGPLMGTIDNGIAASALTPASGREINSGDQEMHSRIDS